MAITCLKLSNALNNNNSYHSLGRLQFRQTRFNNNWDNLYDIVQEMIFIMLRQIKRRLRSKLFMYGYFMYIRKMFHYNIFIYYLDFLQQYSENMHIIIAIKALLPYRNDKIKILKIMCFLYTT